MTEEIDELIDELTATEPSHRPTGPDRAHQVERGRRLAAVLAGLVALAAVGGGAYWLGTRSVDDSVAGSDPASPTVEKPEEDIAGEAAAPANSDTAPPNVTTTALSTTTRVTLPSIAATEDNPEGAIRYTVYSGGKIYMRGFVRSDEEGEQIIASIAAAVGPDIVVNELVADPATPESVATHVYFEDAILFEIASAEIQPEFQGLLNLVPLFLNPAAGFELTIVAKTDASGSEEFNLVLATDRANAIVDYLVGIGVDPSLLMTDPRGEADAIETNDPEQAAQQRRVEFLFTPS